MNPTDVNPTAISTNRGGHAELGAPKLGAAKAQSGHRGRIGTTRFRRTRPDDFGLRDRLLAGKQSEQLLEKND
jgi:hypothetical protein